MNLESSVMSEEFSNFIERVGLVLAIDYGSRGGNAFFLTLFDTHPEVASMPWVMYCYSYIYTEYGKTEILDARKAHQFVTNKGYFRYIYNDPTDVTAKEIEKWGGSPYAIENRSQIRKHFDEIVLSQNKISRKHLVGAMFFSYLKALNIDIGRIKYLLLSDAITLRIESARGGFSGGIIDAAKRDFSQFTLVNLHRDLRAQFASCRHQFINEIGNMYGLRPGRFWPQLIDMIRCNFRIENFCFHYWAEYQLEAYYTMVRHSAKTSQVIHSINEKINLDFIPTMHSIVAQMGVEFLQEWRSPNYVPSSMKVKWKGTGAYNNTYQKIHDGPLKNDSNEVAEKSIGPNAITPNRWKKRLPFSEKIILTYFFYDQLKRIYPDSILINSKWLKIWYVFLVFPFSGEMPHSEMFKGKNFFKGIHYTFSLPVFYLFSRISLFRLILRMKKARHG